MVKRGGSPSVEKLDSADQAGQGCLNGREIGTELPQSEAAGEDVKGAVVNIQRFSTHDGPGVRTTVFLKGCTNACAWCHNPEALRPQPEVQIFPDRCIGCGRCLEICPERAHELVGEEKVFRRERCRQCGRCVEECFAGALVMAGRSVRVDEVMAEILQDEPYYRHSGGGVTFSGGEPVLQKDFLLGLLRRCRESGVHAAIETAGNCAWAWLEELLPCIDLVMYDLKVLNPELHEEYVGNDGKRACANLLKVAEGRIPLIVRTPVVGGINDTVEEIGGIARFIQDFDSLLYYELLPYHPLGESKRLSLGLPEEDRFYTPGKEKMAELADAARAFVGEVRP